jgi:hypothetical protein
LRWVRGTRGRDGGGIEISKTMKGNKGGNDQVEGRREIKKKQKNSPK